MTLRVLACVMAVMVAGALLTACGEDTGDTSGNPDAPFVGPAREIEDGAKKYNPNQGNCPVCNKGPINPDFYHDLPNNQGRIYFDKKECRDKFKQDPQKYLEQFRQRAPGGRSYQEVLRQQQQRQQQQQ